MNIWYRVYTLDLALNNIEFHKRYIYVNSLSSLHEQLISTETTMCLRFKINDLFYFILINALKEN